MTDKRRLGRSERAVLEKHHALQKGENAFQRRARLLQSLWREDCGLPWGYEGERAIGSRLRMPEAEESLAGFLTETIRDLVLRERLEGDRARLMEPNRLFANLLSSQPLCFNLFGELSVDLDLATRFLGRRLPGVERVEGIDFEWSPGRGDARFTGDKSAFDVFLRYRDEQGRAGFLGVEVKYHESLQDRPAEVAARHRSIAERMGCFRSESRSALEARPLQQVWRDHLLAGAVLQSDLPFERGLFVVLYPRGNFACRDVLDLYEACLSDGDTFARWTLEDVVDDLRAAGATGWIDDFANRYLAFERVDALIEREERGGRQEP